MQFSELKDEYAARGFDYHSDSRRGRYINFGRAQLDAMHPWPYRKTSGTGTVGTGVFTASDLGVPYMVQDTANSNLVLTPMHETEIRRQYPDLTLTDHPFAYYVSNGTVTAYPVGGTLEVFYYLKTPDLSSPTDTPEAPDAYHGLIVDMAVQMAYRDSDDHAAATQIQAWIDRQVQAMVDDLMVDQVQAPTYRVLPHRCENW